MPITQVHTYDNGLTIGFDSEVNDWVRVDPQALEGSTLGNIGRAAGRSVEGISLGAQQLLDPAGAAPDIERLRQQEEAASAGAPIASMVGGAVPDVAAGAALAAGTGGMGLLPMVGAEVGLGALLGGIRPGSVEDRAQNAAVSSLLTVAGLGMGAAASKGIGVALKAFGVVEDKMLRGIASTTEAAGTRLRAADEAAALDQAGSVGAARAGVTDEFAQETAALEATTRSGGDIDTLGAGARRQIAEDLGYRSPLGAGTRMGSSARKVAAVRQAGIGDIFEQQVMHDNQRLMSTKLADALGLPEPEKYTSIYPYEHLADAEQASTALFQQVEADLPALGVAELERAYKDISQKSGLFGKTQGQKIVNDAIERAQQRGGLLDGEEIMNDRAQLSEEMSRMYRDNQPASGDALRDAIAKLDGEIEKRLKAKDAPKNVAANWEKARGQWQVLSMVKRPGVLSDTGDINITSLMRQMRADKRNAGFGRDGPVRGSRARQVWDIGRVMAEDQTHIPLTGYRSLIAKQLQKGGVGKTAVAGGGLYGAGSALGLWD